MWAERKNHEKTITETNRKRGRNRGETEKRGTREDERMRVKGWAGEQQQNERYDNEIFDFWSLSRIYHQLVSTAFSCFFDRGVLLLFSLACIWIWAIQASGLLEGLFVGQTGGGALIATATFNSLPCFCFICYEALRKSCSSVCCR